MTLFQNPMGLPCDYPTGVYHKPRSPLPTFPSNQLLSSPFHLIFSISKFYVLTYKTLYQFPKASIAKYHEPGGLNNSKFLFHSHGSYKSEIKVWAELLCFEVPLIDDLLVPLHRVFLCICTCLCPNFLFLQRHQSYCLFKVCICKYGQIGFRSSSFEFGENTIPSISKSII